MKRMKANDPNAYCGMGHMCRNEGNHEGAFEYYSKAAELGDSESHFNLSLIYAMGEGVEKDKKREMYHLQEAAIGGHPKARWNRGCREKDNGKIDKALTHWIIAANLGNDGALEAVKLSVMDA